MSDLAREPLIRRPLENARRRSPPRYRCCRARLSRGTARRSLSSFLPTITGCVGDAVEDFLELLLDQPALLLDHDDPLETIGEAADGRGIERPGAGDLEDAHAERRGAHLVDAELVERLLHVEIALARRGDADARLLAAADHDAGRAH